MDGSTHNEGITPSVAPTAPAVHTVAASTDPSLVWTAHTSRAS